MRTTPPAALQRLFLRPREHLFSRPDAGYQRLAPIYPHLTGSTRPDICRWPAPTFDVGVRALHTIASRQFMVGKGGIFDDIAGFQRLTTGKSWEMPRQRRDNLTQIPPRVLCHSVAAPISHVGVSSCPACGIGFLFVLRAFASLRLCVKRAWLSTCPGIPCRGLWLIHISILQYVKELSPRLGGNTVLVPPQRRPTRQTLSHLQLPRKRTE